MSFTLTRGALALILAVGAPLAVAVTPASATTTPKYTWKAAAVPADAKNCAAQNASPRGTQYIVECHSLPADRRQVVMQAGQQRMLADTVGTETFEKIIPERVTDSGWVYGVVGHQGASNFGGGWRVARWTPAGQLQLAPATPSTATHQDISKPTTADTFVTITAANEQGTAVVNYYEGFELKSSGWLWHADGTTTAVMPAEQGRFSEVLGLADDGTVVFNDRVPGKDAYGTPRPYRRLPNGTNVLLPAGTLANTEVHSISPSGQHVAGASVSEPGYPAPWLRWDAPGFAAAEQASIDSAPTFAWGLNDAGVYVTGRSVVHGTTEVALQESVTGTVPEGAIESYDVLADGTLFAHTILGTDETPGEVGWLVPSS